MPSKRRKISLGPTTPAKNSEKISIHSVNDSNDYLQCLYNYLKMPRDHCSSKAQWDESMELRFCLDYVEWKRSGKWDPNALSDTNWMRFTHHLNSIFGKTYAVSVYHSKFQRLKKIWRAYAKLKGYRRTPETGIGWDEEVKCFMADDAQWNNLVMENKDYNHFRFRQPVNKYEILSEVLDGETATGSQAQASSVAFAQMPRQPRTYGNGAQTVDLKDDNDVYQSYVPDKVARGSKWAGKRPASSQGVTNSYTASRGTKSSKSSENNLFVNCTNSLSNLANTKLKIHEARDVNYEQYDVTIAAQVVATFKDVVPPGKRIVALEKLQNDKWRKTFLAMDRELQEYWLHSLKPAEVDTTLASDSDQEY